MARSSAPLVAVIVVLSLLHFGCNDGDDSTGAEVGGGPDPAAPGGRPTIAPASAEGVAERAPRPTVIASGRTQRGDAFEVVARGTEKGICLTTMYPQRGGEAEGGAVCGRRLFPELTRAITLSGTSKNGSEEAIDGYVSGQVASVEINFGQDGEARTLQATVEPLPGDILRAGGGTPPLGFFKAFLPDGVAAEQVIAVPFGSDGEQLASAGV